MQAASSDDHNHERGGRAVAEAALAESGTAGLAAMTVELSLQQIFTSFLGWMVLRIRSDTARDIEILVLRHQLAVIRRRTPHRRIRHDRLGGLIHEYQHVA